MKTAQWVMESEIGKLYLVASEKGLQGVFFDKQTAPMPASLNSNTPETRILSQAVAELEEYLSGRRKKFSVKFDIDGTAFQMKVWKQLTQIPYGKTVSYKDIAARIKNKKAVRAVGTANGRNPLCIFIPCHRVIAADGTLGGYSAGIAKKIKLLELERGRASL